MTTSRSRWASMQFAPLAERTSIPARTTLRQDCDEPHPEADKLLIRPTRQPGPAPAARTDKSHSGHHQLGRSVFGSRPCRRHQSQTTRRETGGSRLTISAHRHDIPPALPVPSPTAGARSSHRPQKPGKNRVLTGSGLGQQNASTRRCCSPIRPNTSAPPVGFEPTTQGLGNLCSIP
jgi:hypothetical protein